MIKSSTASVALLDNDQAAMRFQRRTLAAVIAAALASLSTSVINPAWSATWSGSSGISLEATAVQTNTSAGSVTDRSSSLTIEPFYLFNRESPAQSLNGRIGIEHTRFSGDGGQSTTPTVSLDSRTTLSDRRLWLNAEARAASSRISAAGFSDDSPTGDDETTTSVQLQLGPEFRYQPANDVVIRGSSAVGGSWFNGRDGESDSSDTTSVGVEGDVLYSIGSSGHILGFESRFQHTESDAGEQATTGSLAIRHVVPVTPQLTVYWRVGYDWLTFDEEEGVDTDEDLSQEQFALGIRWRPDRRLELNAEYAERAFGRQPTMSMIIMGRRSDLEFRWSRDLQISQFINTDLQGLPTAQSDSEEALDEQTNLGLDALQGCNGTGVGVTDCESTPFVVDLDTVEEEIAAIYTLRGRRSTLGVSLSRTELSDIEGADSRQRDELELSLSRSLARNLGVTLTGTFSETQTADEILTSSDSQAIRITFVWLSR